MKSYRFALGIILMMGSCGYETDNHHASLTKVIPSINQVGPLSIADDATLKTDSDVAISGLYGWIDLMPGVGFAGGPHTRLQVKFKALGRECTTARDYSASLTFIGERQVLTIKRVKKDGCVGAIGPVDINLNVYGTYKPTAPVVVNGVELPVMERIIY